MSVFKEGYKAIETIQRNTQQVFNDACDAGAPVYIDGVIWKVIQTLVNYLDDDERAGIVRTNEGCTCKVTLIDEWAVSDQRKTYEQAQDTFVIEYQKLDTYQNKPYLTESFKGADGYVNVYKEAS